MEEQYLINLAFGFCSLIGGWVLSRIFILLDRLDKDVRNMPAVYVSKTDYRNDIHEIKTMLRRIDEKIEHKADK